VKGIKWLHYTICKIKASQEDHYIEMDSVSSRISDVTYNYKEFREPLVATESNI